MKILKLQKLRMLLLSQRDLTIYINILLLTIRLMMVVNKVIKQESICSDPERTTTCPVCDMGIDSEDNESWEPFEHLKSNNKISKSNLASSLHVFQGFWTEQV